MCDTSVVRRNPCDTYIPLKVNVSGVNGYSTNGSSLIPTQIVALIKCAGHFL